MAGLDSCPPDRVEEKAIEAYRFVKQEVADESFVPVGKMNPSGSPAGKAICPHFGLSLFVSNEAARSRFAELKKRNKNIGKKIGNEIAVGNVQREHGKCTDSNTHGHFTLYEYEGVKLADLFHMVEEEEPTHG